MTTNPQINPVHPKPIESINSVNNINKGTNQIDKNIETIEKNKKTPNKTTIFLGATALAVSIAVATFLGVGGSKKPSETNRPTVEDTIPDNKESSNPTTLNTEPTINNTKPNESTEIIQPDSSELIPSVEDIEIDSSLIKNPEEFAKVWIEEAVTNWFNAGSTPENAKKAFESYSIPMLDFANTLAAEYDDVYTEALLVEGWESNPNIVEWVDKMKKIHAQTLYLYFITSFKDLQPEDKSPYVRSSKFLELKSWNSVDNETFSAIFGTLDCDNSEKNRVGESLTGNQEAVQKENATPIYATREFVIVDDKIKLSNIILDRR